MKKFLLISLLVLVGLGVAAVAGKNVLLKGGIIAGTKHATGMDLLINKFRLGLVSSDVDMQGLSLLNPAHYPVKEMVNCPDIYCSLSVPNLFKREIRIREARFHMKEFNVVKNKDGKVNITEMKGLLVKKKGEQKPAPQEQGKTWPLYIEKLDLQIGTVVYKDFSRGGEPLTQTFRVDLKETYYDIEDPKAFANLVVQRALFKTSIHKLADLNIDEMNQLARATVEDSAKYAKKQMERGVTVAREEAMRLREQTQERLGEARETIQGTTANIDLKKSTQNATENLKSIFGGGQEQK